MFLSLLLKVNPPCFQTSLTSVLGLCDKVLVAGDLEEC